MKNAPKVHPHWVDRNPTSKGRRGVTRLPLKTILAALCVLLATSVPGANFYRFSALRVGPAHSAALNHPAKNWRNRQAPSAPRTELKSTQPLSTLASPPEGPNSMMFFAADCETPKSTFSLGETVCVQVSEVDPNLNAHIDWVGASGLVLSRGPDIPEGSQTATFTIPTNGRVGSWRCNITSASDGAPRATALFTVRDPLATFADVAVGNFAAQTTVTAGANVTFNVSVTNLGPDAAANVQLTDEVPANTRFVSAIQTDGPGFTCNNPAPGENGTTTCSIASLAKDAIASFVLTYHVDAGTPEETLLTNSAAVSSSTSDLFSPNNSANDSLEVFQQTCVPPTFTIADPIVVWSPNNMFRTVGVSDLVTSVWDSCDPNITIDDVVIWRVSSDEGTVDSGDIIIAPDCRSVHLRATRFGNGNGRVYTITFKVTDASGNVSTAFGEVRIPHDQGNGSEAINDGPAYTVASSCP